MRKKEPKIGRREVMGVLGAASSAWAFGSGGPSSAEKREMQVARSVPTSEILRHGAYVCLTLLESGRRTAEAAAVPALAGRLGLRNEFDPGEGHPSEAVAFLRRIDAAPGDVADDHLLHAHAVLHVASREEAIVAEFCAGAVELLRGAASAMVLDGVVRPPRYTGAAMHEFAYARQVLQQAGQRMPNAFLLPLRKNAAWWAKDWMERHTYFLPRYDEAGRRVSEGHALAAAAGIPVLLRRTYKSRTEPAPEGEYDFLTYFECADESVATFREVCEALRDVERNPEWRFVQEGPTWHGRRVATWSELFT